jgi:hypothetical protein
VEEEENEEAQEEAPKDEAAIQVGCFEKRKHLLTSGS